MGERVSAEERGQSLYRYMEASEMGGAEIEQSIIDAIRKAEQAARAAAIEECAELADEKSAFYRDGAAILSSDKTAHDVAWGAHKVFDELAYDIRALSSDEKED